MAVVKPGEAWSAGKKKVNIEILRLASYFTPVLAPDAPLTNSKIEEKGESGLEQGSHGSTPRIQVWSVDSQYFSPC